MSGRIRVTIWNEYRHEQMQNAEGEYIRRFYPGGMHRYLKQALQADDLEITVVSLDMPEQGLPDDLLERTDVLMWWGHIAHEEVREELVEKIQKRVLRGMGLIVLHSGHLSRIFRKLMGTSCLLHWRDVGEKERVWNVAPGHPITQGIPESFVIPHSEMYGERFDIPDDGKLIFLSWYEGGNVFRSGVAFQRNAGRIFYFSPGHETYPIYYDKVVQKVLNNAIRWAAPAEILPERTDTHQEELEKIEKKFSMQDPLPDLG